MTGLRITDADPAALGAHAEARRTLAALGKADLARGAAIVSTVADYTLAARPVADAAALERAVEALSAFVTSIEPERQGFVAGLLDAALAAQMATRMTAGLPPHGRRIDVSTSVCVVAGNNHRHLEKAFDHVVRSDGPVAPSSFEAMLIPGVLAAAVVHAPIGLSVGIRVPLGILSFDPKVVERMSDQVAPAFERFGPPRAWLDASEPERADLST